MKPFDLQAALKGAPVVTREGKKVDKIYLIPEINQVIAIANGVILCYRPIDGLGDYNRDYDLFMGKTKKQRTLYVNVYSTHCYAHNSAELAEQYAQNQNLIAVAVPTTIEWEE